MKYIIIISVPVMSLIQTVISFGYSINLITISLDKTKCFKKIKITICISGFIDFLLFALQNFNVVLYNYKESYDFSGNYYLIIAIVLPFIIISMIVFDRKVLQKKYAKKFGENKDTWVKSRYNGLIVGIAVIKWMIVLLTIAGFS